MFNQNLRKNLISIALLILIWSPLQAGILYKQFPLNWYEAGIDALITSLLLSLTGFVITNTLSFYHPTRKQIPVLVLGVLTFTYGAVMASELIIQMVGDWSFLYLKEFNIQRLTYSSLIGLLLFSVGWAQTSRKASMEDEQRMQATQKIARDAELASLRQQLQPHFLFNSLNSINALIGSQPEKARMMIQQLSDFLRGTVKKDDSQLVPLFEELQQLRLYLDIEKVRFGHRLATEMDSDNASLSCKLPPLLIQPVVENAIKFGLYDTVGETVIKIKTSLSNNHLVIEVENPFDAVTSAPRQGTGFGLSSLQRRLYLLYARNDLLTTTQVNSTFITQIRIPQQA